MPFDIINQWIEQEKIMGSPSPDMVVLATATKNGIPHCRIVAIREISYDSVLFFTQRNSRKVTEIRENPNASMTLWLPLQQKEIVFEGTIDQISETECKSHWDTYPKERQLRFLSYAPTSGRVIESQSLLEDKLASYREQYQDRSIEMSADYFGFRLNPSRIYFYSLETNSLSKVIEYKKNGDDWKKSFLSP